MVNALLKTYWLSILIFIGIFILYNLLVYWYKRTKIRNKTVAKDVKLIEFKHNDSVAYQYHLESMGAVFIVASIPFFINTLYTKIAIILFGIGALFMIQGVISNIKAQKYEYWLMKKKEKK